MIRRESDMPQEVRAEMRGGKGSITIRHLEQALLPEKARLFAKITIPPGASIGEHEHIGEAEIFYFASGEGFVTDDGERHAVKVGDVLTTASGHRHSVENPGPADLVLIASIVKD